MKPIERDGQFFHPVAADVVCPFCLEHNAPAGDVEENCRRCGLPLYGWRLNKILGRDNNVTDDPELEAAYSGRARRQARLVAWMIHGPNAALCAVLLTNALVAIARRDEPVLMSFAAIVLGALATFSTFRLIRACRAIRPTTRPRSAFEPIMPPAPPDDARRGG